MKIFFVRHPKTIAEPGLCYGALDISAKDGWQTAVPELVKQLPPLSDCQVWSSDLSRAVVLAKSLAPKIKTSPLLRELDFGHWEGRNWAEIPVEESLYWTEDIATAQTPEGESFTDLQTRVRHWWQILKVGKCPKNLVVVCHAGTIRAFFAEFLGYTVSEVFALKIPFMGVRVFEFQEHTESFSLLKE